MSKSFFKNLIYNNTSQGLQFGSRWIFNLVLIALLNDYDFGIFTYGLALANLLMAILPFGSPVYLINNINKENKFKELADSLMVIMLFFLIIFLFYFAIRFLPITIKNYDILFNSLILGLSLAINTVMYYFLKSTGNFIEEIKVSFLFFLLIIGFVFYFYYLGNEMISVANLINSLILFNLLVFVYLIIFSKKIKIGVVLNNIDISILNIKKNIKKRWYFGLQEMMTAIYTQLGMFILFYFLSAERYGLYRKLFVLIAPIYLLSVSLSQVLLHHLKNNGNSNLLKEFRKYQKITFIIATSVIVLIYFIRIPLIELLGKINYTNEINIAFSLVLFIAFIRFIYGNYEMFLVSIGKQNLRFWTVLIAAIVNIISIFVLVPMFNLIGAILTTLLSNLIVLISLFYLSEKNIKKNENSHNNF